MVYVIRSSWPMEETKEVLKATMQLPPIPDYINRRVYSSSDLGEGIECFDIYEFDASKINEATEFLYSRIQAFFGVSGFSYDIKPWMDEQEVMAFSAKLMSA